eukprot:SAG22_NODE_436_length_10519_cov_21.912188_7_plen_136_part_00
MTKLNRGNAPPTTHPSRTPHVCVGAKPVARPARLADWSVDDVLTWLVDVARVSGDGAQAVGGGGQQPGSGVDYRREVVAQELDGRALEGMLRRQKRGGAVGGKPEATLPKALGMTRGEHLARLAAAVTALPHGAL